VNTAFVRQVLRFNVVALLVALPLAWWYGAWSSLVATAVAGGLGAANFAVGAMLVQRFLDGSAERTQALLGLMLAGKFGLLAAIAFIAVVILGLDAVGFVIGLSTTVLALIVIGFRFSMGSLAQETESEV
jgi:hypothetical protein